MNLKHITLLAGISLLGASISGCSKDDNITTVDSIELSTPTTLDFEGSALEQSIDVSATSKFSFIKKGDWLQVSQSGNKLVLQAPANEEPSPRTAELLVISGKVSRKIHITQGAGGVSHIVLSDNSTTIRHRRRTLMLDLGRKVTDWQVESSASWVKLTPIQHAGRLTIDVEANPTYENRVAKLIFTFGSEGTKEFTLTQLGKARYVLPSFDFLTDNIGVRRFEFSRSSALNQGPDGIFNLDQWSYLLDSDLFGSVTYKVFNDAAPQDFGSNLEYYKRATLFARNSNLFSDKREFEGMKQFLESEGFVWNNTFGWYENTSKEVKAEIKISGGSRVVYESHPAQPAAFSPIRDLSLSNLQAKTIEQVKEWEARNGGVFKPESSSEAAGQYWFEANDDQLLGRFYAVDTKTGNVTRRNYQYKDKSLAFFGHKGSHFLTKEFLLKARSEGFTYDTEFKHRLFRFVHLDKKIYLFVLIAPSGNLALQVEPLG